MALVDPPERLQAEIFHQELSGSHDALLLTARGANGPVQCVVKLEARLGLSPLPYLVEWVAAAVGRALGVAVPEPYVVEVTPEFAQAISTATVRDDALRSCGDAFGCRFMPHYFQWTSATPLHPDLREAASELLAFDIFVHNFDRTDTNANLLARRDELLAIDHDLALEFVYPAGCAQPELDPRLDVVQKHVFGQALKRKLARLQTFRARVRDLSDEWFADLVSATPQAWQGREASGKLVRIVEVLRKRRDHVESWLTKVEAWLE